MSTDDPHWLKCHLKSEIIFCTFLSSSSCRCVETPLSSIVSQRKQNLRNNNICGKYSHGGMMDYTRFPISDVRLGKLTSKLEVQLQN